MLVNFLPVNVENPLSDQLSVVSNSCQRSPSVLSLCVVEDESLGRMQKCLSLKMIVAVALQWMDL